MKKTITIIKVLAAAAVVVYVLYLAVKQ